MSTDRTSPLTDQALDALRARQADARMSLACEGLHLTEADEAVFAEMARLRLSRDERIEHLKTYLSQSAPALAAE